MYAVFHASEFDKQCSKLFSSEEERKISQFARKQLSFNPYVGDPLRYPFLREKKLGSKRVYYLIYEELKVVYLVQASDKKHQQSVIDAVLKNLELYYRSVKEIIKQRGERDHV